MKSVKTKGDNKLLKHIDRKMYDSVGYVDYNKLKSTLNIRIKTLAAAVGKTTRAVEKNPHSESIQKVLRKIVFIFSLLKEMLETETEVLIWIKSPNPEFGGLSPMDTIVKGEIDAVIEYLLDIRKGALT